MKLSELSARSGVSVPTVKYYLREGLLPQGADEGGRAAGYGEHHLARLRLIRALLDSGGLSIAAAREVVAALESRDIGWPELLGRAQYALSAPQRAPGTGATAGRTAHAGAPAEVAEIDDVSARLAAWGWQVSSCSPVLAELRSALSALERADVPVSAADLARYARAMHEVAAIDVSTVPRSSPEAALRQVVLGTVLLEPVLAAMRKLAQEDVSRQLGSPGQRA